MTIICPGCDEKRYESDLEFRRCDDCDNWVCEDCDCECSEESEDESEDESDCGVPMDIDWFFSEDIGGFVEVF